mgnify:CR=1 FL=1
MRTRIRRPRIVTTIEFVVEIWFYPSLSPISGYVQRGEFEAMPVYTLQPANPSMQPMLFDPDNVQVQGVDEAAGLHSKRGMSLRGPLCFLKERRWGFHLAGRQVLVRVPDEGTWGRRGMSVYLRPFRPFNPPQVPGAATHADTPPAPGVDAWPHARQCR